MRTLLTLDRIKDGALLERRRSHSKSFTRGLWDLLYVAHAQLLAASLRHPLHVMEAARAGADIATMPYAVFEKLWKHPLTDIGLQKFLADWNNPVIR